MTKNSVLVEQETSSQTPHPEKETPDVSELNKQLAREINKLERADSKKIISLIKQGANIETRGWPSDWTAAHIAAVKNDKDLMNELIQKGADLNAQSSLRKRSPLFYATSGEMVDLLIQHKADPLLADHEKILPLQALLRSELDKREQANLQLIKVLLKHGADVNTQGTESGWTVAHIAAVKDDKDLMNELIQRGADLNAQSSLQKRSPLFYAKNAEMVDLLIQHNANPLLADNEKILPLQPLLRSELDKREQANLQLIKVLLKQGADVNTQGTESGWTAAHVAACKDDQEMVKMLASKKANFNLSSLKRERSPLFYVKNVAMMNLFLANGADLNQKSKSGKPAFEVLMEEPVAKKEFQKILLARQFNDRMLETNTEILVAAAGSPEKADTLRLLHALHRLIKRQNIRMQTQCRGEKGVEDKKALYEQLDKQIQQAIADNKTDDVANFIFQVATICHHRRHRTLNKAVAVFTLGFFTKNANSWNEYKDFVDKDGDKFGPKLKAILDQSKGIRRDKIHCLVKPSADAAPVDVQGYEEYRLHALNR